jgi:hypothetical protein
LCSCAKNLARNTAMRIFNCIEYRRRLFPVFEILKCHSKIGDPIFQSHY